MRIWVRWRRGARDRSFFGAGGGGGGGDGGNLREEILSNLEKSTCNLGLFEGAFGVFAEEGVVAAEGEAYIIDGAEMLECLLVSRARLIKHVLISDSLSENNRHK
jgi:hypothetical protein